MSLKTVIFTSDIMSTSISFVANFTLLYLIHKKTPIELKPYSKIMRQNSFVDIFFAFSIGMTFFQIDVDHEEYILLLQGAFKNLPPPWGLAMINLYIFALYFCITSTAIPFCYRYFLVVREHKLDNSKFYLLYVFTGILSMGLVVIMYVATFPSWDPEIRKEFLHALDDFWIEDDGSYPFFIASHMNNPLFIGVLAYALCLISVSYAFIAWFCIKTWRHLTRFKNVMSEKTRKLQRQLTYTLIAQSLVPFAVGALPAIVILSTLLLNIKVRWMGTISITVLSWISVFNPFCVILLVSPYRDAILKRKNTIQVWVS